MKAITLWEPWASAMAQGLKRNETRSWPTKHRGELAICSAVRRMTVEHERLAYEKGIKLILPQGCVLCVVEVFDCVPAEAFYTIGAKLRHGLELNALEGGLGDYTPRRYAWLTRSCCPLRNPVPVTGRQGLFNLDVQTEEMVRCQMAGGVA